MNVFDLDPAGIPTGPWTGDDTWSVGTGDGTIEAVAEGGHIVLRLASAPSGSPAALRTTSTPLDAWTLHLVATITGAPSGTVPGIYATSGVMCTPDGGWLIGSVNTGRLNGRHLITATSDGAVYVDGAHVSDQGITNLGPNWEVATYGGPTHQWTIARLIVQDEITSTLTADMAAMVAEYLGGGLTAAGSWAVAGTGALTVGDIPIPDPPAATPGGSVIPPPRPEPQAPPADAPDVLIRRRSEVMPTPALMENGWPVDWAPSEVISHDYARYQIVVEGVDVTYYLGAPAGFPSWSRTEPFGSSEATLTFPQITAFHQLPAWCVAGASVDILMVRDAASGGGVRSRFAGVLVSFGHSEDDGIFNVNATGAVMADDLQLRQPSFLTAPRDIGEVIAETLNATVSRRHQEVAPVITGCMTSVSGGWEPKVTGYVQQLLATALTDGRQWTVHCDERAPILALKDTTTVQWTVHNGQRGVQIDLSQDWTQAPNVLFGEGIAIDGGRWRNARYPNWRPDNTPPYPNTNPSKTIKVGTTDAMTDTRTGVSDWQRKVGMPVTGRFTQADRRRAIAVQTDAGIQRDGIVGPQTWAASFGTGSNTGTLECFYMPVAYAPAVMPRLYGPDGDDLGPNPEYNPNILRVEEKIDFGQNVAKNEGVQAAAQMLARDIHPGWSGTVTFADIDPQELSRYEIQEGLNGRIRGFRGGDLIVHAAAVDYSEESVTVTVDTNARDYPTLDAIRDRERNATDPAKAAVKRLSKGSITEARATFDAESPAGYVPRHALFSNLWTVIRVPFGSYGSIVRTELTTSGAARPFSVAVFSKPVTAARLLSLIGNPLTAENNPWSEYADELDEAGLIMSWGWANQPAGYYPQEYANPDEDEDAAPVTGRMLDDASWEYGTEQPPWLWVAEIASGSCYIEGRFWPGAD